MEIHLLRKVAHIPGVIQLLDYYERTDSYVLILERPDPVEDLFDHITQKGPLSDATARDYLRQVNS